MSPVRGSNRTGPPQTPTRLPSGAAAHEPSASRTRPENREGTASSSTRTGAAPAFVTFRSAKNICPMFACHSAATCSVPAASASSHPAAAPACAAAPAASTASAASAAAAAAAPPRPRGRPPGPGPIPAPPPLPPRPPEIWGSPRGPSPPRRRKNSNSSSKRISV